MTALATAMEKFNAAIQELRMSREVTPDTSQLERELEVLLKREQLSPVIRSHIAQQRQLANVLYDIAADIGKSGVYATLTLKEADRIFMDAALFEAEEIERLG